MTISVQEWRRKPPLRLTIAKKPDACWLWVNCGHPMTCGHRAAIAIVPYTIRWGPDAWRDMLRRHGRCSKCGRKGVTLTHASWGGMHSGWSEFPVDQIAQS